MSKGSNTDRIMSIMATVVALTAVGIAVFEASIERKHQRLSVFPRLELSQNTSFGTNSFTNDASYQKVIKNSGLGPSILHNY